MGSNVHVRQTFCPFAGLLGHWWFGVLLRDLEGFDPSNGRAKLKIGMAPKRSGAIAAACTGAIKEQVEIVERVHVGGRSDETLDLCDVPGGAAIPEWWVNAQLHAASLFRRCESRAELVEAEGIFI